METYAVVIDTNFLIRDYGLKGGFIRKLIKTKDLYSVELCVPDLVFDECVANYEASVIESKKALESLAGKLNKITIGEVLFSDASIQNRLNRSVAKYKKNLNLFIRDNGVSLLPYPKVAHKEIVRRMYDGKIPFKDLKVKERGYKDFLIVESIREYSRRVPSGKNIILLTENLKDFVGDESFSDGGSKASLDLIPLSAEFELERVYIARSAASLFNSLGRNIGRDVRFDNGSNFLLAIGEAVKKSIVAADADFWFEMFSNYHLDIEIDKATVKCEVFDCAANFDEEAHMLDASGVLNISFLCSFKVDNLDLSLKLLGREFSLFKLVDERVRLKALSVKDDWVEEFNAVKFSAEFLFDFVDFDFVSNDFKDGIDPAFLSIYRI